MYPELSTGMRSGWEKKRSSTREKMISYKVGTNTGGSYLHNAENEDIIYLSQLYLLLIISVYDMYQTTCFGCCNESSSGLC
jgi:hypothetical protein